MRKEEGSMKGWKRIAALAASVGLLLALCGCDLFARVEPVEETAPAAEEPVEEEETPAVEIDSPIVGTWHNTYTADGTTSTMTFRADGTGCETEQSDADADTQVDFTYTVIEDYVEITVDTTTLHFTYTIDGTELALTYQGYSTAD